MIDFKTFECQELSITRKFSQEFFGRKNCQQIFHEYAFYFAEWSRVSIQRKHLALTGNARTIQKHGDMAQRPIHYHQILCQEKKDQ